VALLVYLVHRRRVVAAVPVALILAAAAVVVGLTPIRAAQEGETLLAEGESAYQYVRVSRAASDGVEQLRLQVNEPVTDYHSLWVPGKLLTGSYYDHYSLLPFLLPDPPGFRRPLSILILGLAAGVISRQMHAFIPKRLEHIDGVELDPVMVDLARVPFGLDAEQQPRLAIHILDGRLFLKACGNKRLYDIVIVDAYAHQIYLPPHMTTVSFFHEVRNKLRPGGIVALNASAYQPGEGLLPRLVNTVARVFGEAFLARTCPGNYMLFAFKDRPEAWPPAACRPEDLPAPLREIWTAFTAPRHALRFVDDPGSPVFTDDDCPVEILATRDLERAAACYAGSTAR
jgi:spermidine synthase